MKKNILLLFFILAGAMVGSLIASAAAGVPMLSCLEMGLSIAQIGCIILSLFGYRWALKKI